MTNSDTTPSNINPDPTKWSDRTAEFSASAATRTSAVVAGATGVAAVVATAAVAGVAGAAVAAFIAVGTFVMGAGVVATAVAGAHDPMRPRLLARKLGLVFPSLAALAVSGSVAYAVGIAPQSPAPPVSAAPDVIFNATAQDCKSERVTAVIDKIKADGFPVRCAKPSL